MEDSVPFSSCKTIACETEPFQAGLYTSLDHFQRKIQRRKHQNNMWREGYNSSEQSFSKRKLTY